MWRRRIGIVAGAIAIPLCVTWIADAVEDVLYWHRVFGTTTRLGAPVFDHQEWILLNGDGYSFTVYRLPGTVRSRFEGPDADLLDAHPVPADYQITWAMMHWRPGSKEARQIAIDMVGGSVEEDPALREYESSLVATITSPRTYYATCENWGPEGDFVRDAALWVVDLDEGLIYFVQFNS